MRLDGSETRIAVYVGAVRARTASGAVDIIRAGQKTRLSDQGIASVEAADPANEFSTRGLYIARHVPLHIMMKELERYRVGYISMAPALRNLPVFGSYPITDPDRTLAMLESVMPIRVHRPMPWWVKITPR